MISLFRKPVTSYKFRICQLKADQIDRMCEFKHDLGYQLGLCRQMMPNQEILPFPFHRAVILLSKAKRFDEALELCLYVKTWCEGSAAEHVGDTAMVWESPKLKDLVSRIPKLEAKRTNPRPKP